MRSGLAQPLHCDVLILNVPPCSRIFDASCVYFDSTPGIRQARRLNE